MRKSNELLLIRYLSIIILIADVLIKGKSTNIASIVFLLAFIINNNLRIFFFKKEKSIVLSMVIELVSIVFAYLNFGGNILFYLIGVTIDVFSIKDIKIKSILAVVILIISTSSYLNGSIESGIINLIVIIIFSILLSYISKLYDTKKEAQRLYDKLRISEENLREANNNLEECLSSIEELTVLKERNRISREIHDSVGHALSTAMIQLSAMEALADKEGSILKDMLKNLRNFINESFQDVKKAVKELKSEEYNTYRGVIRIQEVCKNFKKMSGIDVDVIISKGTWALSPKQDTHLHRITQEILSNSLKHGKATKVKVIMNFTEEDFVISFKDNGIGTDSLLESGFGLKNIKERAYEIGGTVDIKSALGEGFFIKLVVPREREI